MSNELVIQITTSLVEGKPDETVDLTRQAIEAGLEPLTIIDEGLTVGMNIVGEKGEIDWDYYSGEASLSEEGTVTKKASLPENWERNDLFLSIMKNFLEAINNNARPLVPLTEGIEVLRIAMAAKESIC